MIVHMYQVTASVFNILSRFSNPVVFEGFDSSMHIDVQSNFDCCGAILSEFLVLPIPSIQKMFMCQRCSI